jgi:hypothetical protein
LPLKYTVSPVVYEVLLVVKLFIAGEGAAEGAVTVPASELCVVA